MRICCYLLFRWGVCYSTLSFGNVSWETGSCCEIKRDKGAEKGTLSGPFALAEPHIHDGFLLTSDLAVIWIVQGAPHSHSEGCCHGVGSHYIPVLPPWMSGSRFSTCLCRCKSRVLHQHLRSRSKIAPAKLGTPVFKLKNPSWYSFALINAALLFSIGPTSAPMTFIYSLGLYLIYSYVTVAQTLDYFEQTLKPAFYLVVHSYLHSLSLIPGFFWISC